VQAATEMNMELHLMYHFKSQNQHVWQTFKGI